ncbi:MAG: Stp1/IreP family PP2C-type Ser/Thr phosphatase [Mariprofundaceae bacterium]|nr:Stp1/IreP family PP2C-type Ser/Thr phosphatase [Mariprofundaceae bacterium]
MISIDMFAITDVGIKRAHNEDCVHITPSHGIAILADGMGGYNAGEVASAMAVDVINNSLRAKILDVPQAEIDKDTGFTHESVLVRQAIKASNEAIYNAAQAQSEYAGMGTTVLVAAFYGNHITAAHVGDSRMYRLRDKTLTHVTVDHSLVHEQVRRGLLTADDARNSRIKNLVTRALGCDPRVEADLVEDMVSAGDLYLMCSDGLTDVVSDEDINHCLGHCKKDLQKTALQLVQMANNAGGPDNISIILIRASEASAKLKGGLFGRLFNR